MLRFHLIRQTVSDPARPTPRHHGWTIDCFLYQRSSIPAPRAPPCSAHPFAIGWLLVTTGVRQLSCVPPFPVICAIETFDVEFQSVPPCITPTSCDCIGGHSFSAPVLRRDSFEPPMYAIEGICAPRWKNLRSRFKHGVRNKLMLRNLAFWPRPRRGPD